MTKHKIMLHAMSLNGGSRTSTTDELRSRILTAWDELDQRVIDMAARPWRTRLRACVKAKGGHFGHRLSQWFRMLLLLITA